MKSYTRKQIAELTGLSPRLVTFYTDEGLVTPAIDEGKGRGRVRRYSQINLFSFAMIKELSDFGIKIEKIRSVFDDWLNKHVRKDIKKFETELRGDDPGRRKYLWIRKTGNIKKSEVVAAHIMLNQWEGKYLGNYDKKKYGKETQLITGIDENLLSDVVSLMIIDCWELYRRVCLQEAPTS